MGEWCYFMSTLRYVLDKCDKYRFWLLALFVFVLGMLCIGFDNGDVWFMDVHAKDILENGFYDSVGKFTAHDGPQVPHQKWAMCLLVHIVVTIGNWFGASAYESMMAGSALFCGLFALCLYVRCREPGYEPRAAAMALGSTFLLSMTCMSTLLSFRPHIIAICMCMIECMLLDVRFYLKHDKLSFRAFLFGIALCSFVTMWFHSTMWPLCFIPVLPHLGEAVLDWIRGRRARAAPIIREGIMAMLVMFLAGCLNPLGLGQLDYMRVTAAAGSSLRYSFIGEMCPFWLAKFDFYTILWLLAVIITGLVLLIDRKNVSVREWLFYLGSAFMSAVSVRLMIYFYGLALPILCSHLGVIRLSDKIKRGAAAGILSLSALSVLLLLPLRSEFREVNPHQWETLSMTADILEQDIEGPPRIFASRTYVASMLLWRGCLPVFDTRVEVFDGDLNGGYDVLTDVHQVYTMMVADQEIPWAYLREHIFDAYDLDAMIFSVEQLPGGLMDGVRTDQDIRTFTVNDEYVVCERLSSLKQQQ